MITFWRIGTDTPTYTAEDMGGIGAKTTGGRWNRQGTALVYTSSSRALSCLETVVHLSSGGLPLNRYLVQVDIPDDVWTKRDMVDRAALVGWDAMPAGMVSLDFGDKWVSSGTSCLLEVPSAIVPEEANILINPAHPDAAKITAVKVRKWVYDARIKP
ncbi:RES family NAD+ phosphorylase [Oryzomicrobium sp.]|uniref:RES family NAD+ phosphorylase n=1 Tax=Oryzomicrobium sp. TaxID=1911578 RepID=UPI002FDFE3FE